MHAVSIDYRINATTFNSNIKKSSLIKFTLLFTTPKFSMLKYKTVPVIVNNLLLFHASIININLIRTLIDNEIDVQINIARFSDVSLFLSIIIKYK